MLLYSCKKDWRNWNFIWSCKVADHSIAFSNMTGKILRNILAKHMDVKAPFRRTVQWVLPSDQILSCTVAILFLCTSRRCATLAICDENYFNAVTQSHTFVPIACCADTMSHLTIQDVSIDWNCEAYKLKLPSMTRLYLNCTPRQGIKAAEDRLSLDEVSNLAELHLLYTFPSERVTYCSCLIWFPCARAIRAMVHNLLTIS